jgi:hypothetical protein
MCRGTSRNIYPARVDLFLSRSLQTVAGSLVEAETEERIFAPVRSRSGVGTLFHPSEPDLNSRQQE